MYDAAFFELIRSGCRESAAVIAPLVHDVVRPRKVIDVGCGEGWWANAFGALGATVVGVDHPDTVPAGIFATESALFRPCDLAEGFPARPGKHDLAVCLEVAEHLPEDRAGALVEFLCRCAPVVLFSAAIPGQGGVGHVNEQWPAYWAALFADAGYAVSGALRFAVWDDVRVEPWYRQNLLVAAAPGRAPAAWFDTPIAPPLPLVHPVLWDSRR